MSSRRSWHGTERGKTPDKEDRGAAEVIVESEATPTLVQHSPVDRTLTVRTAPVLGAFPAPFPPRRPRRPRTPPSARTARAGLPRGNPVVPGAVTPPAPADPMGVQVAKPPPGEDEAEQKQQGRNGPRFLHAQPRPTRWGYGWRSPRPARRSRAKTTGTKRSALPARPTPADPMGARVAKPPPSEAKPSKNDGGEAVRAFRGHTSPSPPWS